MKSEKVKNQNTIVITKKQKNGKQNDKKEKKIKEQITKTPMKNLKRKANESDSPQKVINKKQKVDDFKRLDKDRTVFVGNVPVNTKENDLKKFFSSYGEVETVIIHNTTQSRYELKSTSGKVCFVLPESAVKAKEANGKIFNNFHIRVEPFSEKIKYDPETTIFLSKVPVDAEEEDVRKLFEDCGNVNMVNLRRDVRTNLGRGIGYVNFDSANAVALALKLRSVQIGDRKVLIKRCNEDVKKKKIEEKKDRERFEIIVSNLPEKTVECDLHELFGKCGRITSTRIVHKDITFCYVNFEDSEGVKNAVNMQNPKLHGVPIDIKARTEIVRKPAIYIKNLPINTTNKQIFTIFKDCGAITGLTLRLNKHKPTGVGFVNFNHENAIKKALEKTVIIGNNKLIILRKYNKPKVGEGPGKLGKVKNDEVSCSDAEENEEDENGAESDEEDENGAESDEDEENDGESDENEENDGESDEDEENDGESDEDEENNVESDDNDENSVENDDDEEEYKNELDKILMDAEVESEDGNDDDIKISPKKITPKKNNSKQTPTKEVNRKSVTPKKVSPKTLTPKSASKKVK